MMCMPPGPEYRQRLLELMRGYRWSRAHDIGS